MTRLSSLFRYTEQAGRQYSMKTIFNISVYHGIYEIRNLLGPRNPNCISYLMSEISQMSIIYDQNRSAAL